MCRPVRGQKSGLLASGDEKFAGRIWSDAVELERLG